MDVATMLTEFHAHADAEKAAGMRAYMRDQFEFLGVPTPLRRRLSQPALAAARTAASVDWDFVQACWDSPYREFQYVAVGYLTAVQRLLRPGDMDRIKVLAQTKSWWDTIDGLDRVVGDLALAFPEVNAVLLGWSSHDDIWLRRIAIDHQLGRKRKTDRALLERIILNNLGHTEFFINKAIGWALRDYSKTDPEWVRGFIGRHRSELAPLSVREGSKYL
ncbi:DNA alkylation repair protein [Leucobacter insecticola]|uniref:DNA alkylation repair protein n=1 Tax=Leucobacter insecticola TaxID=2714934 RepID=A0A6G8FKV9_9MICO|nr:DNA alkylation repair protein [Leucobacter insecticola]QIM17120.1 DNA alkylation repair protein [Leucobacter insecticola]